MFLVATNIVSAIAPARRRGDAERSLAGWIERHSDCLHLSVVTSAEIHAGIARARRVGAERKARDLEQWWGEVLHDWHERLLPVDAHVAEATGRLTDVARAAGAQPSFQDAAIAATVSNANLTVLTRNVRHFAPFGCAHLDPLARLPD